MNVSLIEEGCPAEELGTANALPLSLAQVTVRYHRLRPLNIDKSHYKCYMYSVEMYRFLPFWFQSDAALCRHSFLSY
jgi:hypothetical protein